MAKIQIKTNDDSDKFNLVCPFCNKDCRQVLELSSDKQRVKCCSCSKSFYCSLFIVRGKKSKIISDSIGMESRQFDIRVFKFDGYEELISIANHNSIDLELRSNDILSISYDEDNSIQILGNQTINVHLRINHGEFQRGCVQIKDFSYGIFCLLIIILLIKFFSC